MPYHHTKSPHPSLIPPDELGLGGMLRDEGTQSALSIRAHKPSGDIIVAFEHLGAFGEPKRTGYMRAGAFGALSIAQFALEALGANSEPDPWAPRKPIDEALAAVKRADRERHEKAERAAEQARLVAKADRMRLAYRGALHGSGHPSTELHWDELVEHVRESWIAAAKAAERFEAEGEGG
jgi:hypothetical protein